MVNNSKIYGTIFVYFIGLALYDMVSTGQGSNIYQQQDRTNFIQAVGDNVIYRLELTIPDSTLLYILQIYPTFHNTFVSTTTVTAGTYIGSIAFILPFPLS